jgi:hypothetical protein
MRAAVGIAGAAALVVGAVVLLRSDPAAAVCSVFNRHPCNPTVCSVFRRGPCSPEFEPPIGQDLRLTIETTQVAETHDADPGGGGDQSQGDDKQGDDKSEHKLNTIREMFDALRACWVPPPASRARHGMQMSVRLSFKRTGEIIGTPRITYMTPGTPSEVRDTYYNAIMAALDRCTPLPFTNAMGGAIAGRPIAIRFVDDRLMKAEQP